MYFAFKRGGTKVKQPKKPTLEQKKAIKAAGLDPKNWNVAKADETVIKLIRKKSGRSREIKL